MAKPLLDYFPNLRTILQDVPVAGIYAYSDQQCADLLRTVVQTGLGPKGVDISETDEQQLDPAPASPDARGFLVFQAALFALGGTTGVSWKTRAMSVTMAPREREQTINHLRRMINRLETEGNPHGDSTGNGFFGVWEDCENAIHRLTARERIV